MIEIVSAGRCIACDICVRACPSNVFDPMPDAPPVIARQEDCQTCFLCEIYCPTDALYVAPGAEGPTAVSEAEIEAAGLFGSYARALDWRRGKPGGADKHPNLPPARGIAAVGEAPHGKRTRARRSSHRRRGDPQGRSRSRSQLCRRSRG